ncbi:MAG: hypothetical protein US50_C0016G0013 [Candidatus Nomurabacteria bacterium GW2011_GWB1_37_5]|uniref:Smr domain-containing protein n=1 Tax=Candidatus Nomurabacteria bacterium GW2011_GWB1_37_5 TaxID=1618742 RepID=A0A0G0GWK2_9BACT|nr:MAG: hypothetical protein US50_C0016G0013 [Candidatus Nomurabacteria bacterium GW2011_GWB1_37_5]
MNKYIQKPQCIIDLHGYTVSDTEEVLSELIAENQYSHVRIITGKGLNSENGPVLGDFVKAYLNRRNIRYNQSKIQDGGEGALEVFLSSKN